MRVWSWSGEGIISQNSVISHDYINLRHTFILSLHLGAIMICPICSMPQIPTTQLTRDDLPICYNGHTLWRPFGPTAPPFDPEKKRGNGKKKRDPDYERGQTIKCRALAIGVTLSKLGQMCGGSDSVGYSAANGRASVETYEMLEAKLTELEERGMDETVNPL